MTDRHQALRDDEFGPYHLASLLGEGGMGAVFLAEQKVPIQRHVALKVIRAASDSRDLLSRFAEERQALALMASDHIAKLFDAGTSRAGRPYFAMELVEGDPLLTHCDRLRLSTERRLALFLAVCQGVQHAHHKGVMHRDLKPSNILVAKLGAREVPKIIDFGLARAASRSKAERTLPGMVLGTPDYMSPEQARAPDDVDTRTDIYSLGVVLLQLLTGMRPFERLTSSSPLEQHRRILEEDPKPPGTRITLLGAEADALAQARGTDVQGLVRRLRGDLDWVVIKAIAKERERRYQSVDALAADVQRHLRHEPVTACPPSALYFGRKFVRRHRVGVALGVLSAALLDALGHYQPELYADAARSFAAETQARREADTHLARFNQLAFVVKLRSAKANWGKLFPPVPSQAPALRRWLAEDGDPLLACWPQVRAALEGLRARAAAESAATNGARHWREPADQLLYDTLVQLDVDLDAFARNQCEAARADLAWATDVVARSLDAHTDAWAAAARIARASERYASLELAPQLGLVPIGSDRRSGLLEFYDLHSATDPNRMPVRDDQGGLPLDADLGVVFVLLPGGEFNLGAQRADSNGPNDDPSAEPDEGKVHVLRLAPFLLSKYELTQAQWKRLSRGGEPSVHRPGSKTGHDLRNPVENITWTESEQLLARCGWLLPTEAQWEYAARAGRAEPWYVGAEPKLIEGYENVADRASAEARPGRRHEEWRDGFAFTAPVGAFLPDPFGLHDMLGNVWEWCRDRRGDYSEPTQGDAAQRMGQQDERMLRGGSYAAKAGDGRVARRNSDFVDTRLPAIGVQPVRRLER